MNHIQRFVVKNFDDGVESVVGDCNGYTTAERFAQETPIFAKAILSHITPNDHTILDYGCGIGRLAKQILKQNNHINIIGLDASEGERKYAKEYVTDKRFRVIEPEDLNEKVDLIYCIYVLQHVPAVELRHAIERMHYFLKPGGKLIYCSSDYRFAIALGDKFVNDNNLGVFSRIELSRLFKFKEDLFDLSQQPQIIKDMVLGGDLPEPNCIPHPAHVYVRKEIPNIPYFNVRFDI